VLAVWAYTTRNDVADVCCVLVRCTGKVDAYISLELDPSDVVECYDEDGKNIFLYPNNDLVIRPYMNAQLGTTA